MVSTTLRYELITRDLDRTLERTANEPVVARESAYYLKTIPGITSIDAFMSDDRLYRFAMKAHGMEDMTYAKAFIRKALDEGIDDPDSFANKLIDKRYRDFVATFNFARYGETAVAFDRAQQGTVDAFHRQQLEEAAGQDSETLRLALYFERKAGAIDSPYDILADRALLQVVRVALDIPAAASNQSIEKQAAELTDRLDLADLDDPDKLQTFLRRFTTLSDLQNPPQPAAAPAILVGGPIQFGLSASLLTRIQNLKLGGR